MAKAHGGAQDPHRIAAQTKKKKNVKSSCDDVQHSELLGFVRFEVSTAVTMMIIIFWEMTP
jgi:hypothetical protein